MKKKIKIIIICASVVLVIGAGLVLLKTLLSSKGSEKVFYTANLETYENVIEISGTVAAAQQQTRNNHEQLPMLGKTLFHVFFLLCIIKTPLIGFRAQCNGRSLKSLCI